MVYGGPLLDPYPERSVLPEENSYVASPTAEEKTAIFHFPERWSHLLAERSSIKRSLLFPVRLYSLFLRRSHAPSRNLAGERKIKYPTIIRARRRRARISKCVSLYWSLSLSPRPRFWIPFFPKSTSYGLGVGRQESNTPLLPPL